MRILPSGTRGLLLELHSLEQTQAWYVALAQEDLDGVVDLVPAARTILVETAPGTDLTALAARLRSLHPGTSAPRTSGEVLEIPVHYDGADLVEVAEFLGCSPEEVVHRHITEQWTVAFCGFAPGFGYLTGTRYRWDIPRRAIPRTRVRTGSVALAGEFAGVYPQDSPGGWQLIGHTPLRAFDLHREPAALLRPGVVVSFVPL